MNVIGLVLDIALRLMRKKSEEKKWKSSLVEEVVVPLDSRAATQRVVDAIVAAGVLWVRVQRGTPTIVRAQTKELGGLGGAEVQAEVRAHSVNESAVRMKCRTVDYGDLDMRDDGDALVHAICQVLRSKPFRPSS